METEFVPISIDERFGFGCHRGVACFNDCCRDLNQFLTPYDILRLKNHLNVPSGKFLATHTRQHIGPETGLPVVTLKPIQGPDRRCPFVTPSGCRVYPDRPSSCRMYPVARAVTRCAKTGRLSEHFALIREAHCMGFEENRHQTVRAWLSSQQVRENNLLNDLFLDLIRLKNRLDTGPLDPPSQHIFRTALYDIDTFREHIFGRGPVSDPALTPSARAYLKTDEVELLKFAHGYVKRAVFGET